MKTRKVISLISLVSFVIMSYSGLMLFFCPHGRVAYWTGWKLFGLSKEQYGELHTSFMVLFLVSVIWHIVLNWTPIVNYLKNRNRELKIFTPDLNMALVLGVVFAVGTLAGLPPFGQFFWAQENIKDYWEHRDGSPPWGHAEKNTLSRFSRGLVDWERLEHGRLITLDPAGALAALQAAGLSVESKGEIMLDIAGNNDTTPQALMAILLAAATPAESAGHGQPTTGEATESARATGQGHLTTGQIAQGAKSYPMPASGLGRLTLDRYCERYDLDPGEAVSILERAGHKVKASERLRVIAEQIGTDPEGVIDLLNRE
jgi:hypothetical protein